MNIILHQPEIPANTGNIGRTCVATNTVLHLIEPLGFRLNEKEIKRAGMDYWEHLDVRRYMNFEEFLEKNPGARIYMATTKAHKSYTEVSYGPDDFIMFGKESAGTLELTCYLLSVIRLIKPNILLPATTALGTIDPIGREKGILSGANVVMPNLSPVSVRKKYLLYDNKASDGEESAQCVNALSKRMASVGYEIVTDRGDIKII